MKLIFFTRIALAMLLSTPAVSGQTYKKAREGRKTPAIPGKWREPGQVTAGYDRMLRDLKIPTGRYGVGEFVVSALANNPRTQVAWESARQQAARLRQAKGANYPIIDLGASMEGTWADDRTKTGTSFEGVKKPIPGVETLRPSPTAPTVSVFATLTWLLFDFGAREAGINAERRALVSETFFFDRELQSIVRDVQIAYLRWDLARASLAVQDRIVANAKKSVDTFTQRLDAGLGSKVDVLQVEQLYQQTRVDRETFNLEVNQRHAQLLQAAGIPANMKLEIVRGEKEGLPKTLAASSLTQLVEQAMRARADLAAAIATVESREAAYRKARREVWPKFSLFASGQNVMDETRSSFDSRGVKGLTGRGVTRSQHDLWTGTIGIQATINIFDGFAKYGRIDEAASAFHEAQATARNQWLLIAREVAENLYAVRSFSQQRDLAAKLVSISQENYTSIDTALKEGVRSVLDVIESIDNLGKAELANVQADYGLLIGVVDLGHAIGTVEVDAWEANRRARNGGRALK